MQLIFLRAVKLLKMSEVILLSLGLHRPATLKARAFLAHFQSRCSTEPYLHIFSVAKVKNTAISRSCSRWDLHRGASAQQENISVFLSRVSCWRFSLSEQDPCSSASFVWKKSKWETSMRKTTSSELEKWLANNQQALRESHILRKLEAPCFWISWTQILTSRFYVGR